MKLPHPIWISLEVLLVGVFSFGAAYAWERWKSGFHRVAPPRSGTLFRISIGTALLRTRLESATDDFWRFDPPISGSSNVAPTLGQTISGEYLASTGLLRFGAKVIDIEPSGHFSIKVPARTRLLDRRAEPREHRPVQVLIERFESRCIDLSPLGGRFETPYEAKRGERIRLDFPEMGEPIFGWVLENYPNQIRVRFEERVCL